MKKQTFLLFALISFFMANAETRTDSIKVAYDKILNLENRISLQDSQIAKLLQKVDEVTRQNLALKKNLKLSPTIATAKGGEVMEYRIIEVTGDTATNTVHMVMIADNISGQDKSILYPYFQVIDDQGHGIQNSLVKERFIMKVNGETNQLVGHLLDHHSNAPYTIDVYFKDISPDVKYIKYFKLDIADRSVHHNVVFENLPIKWNNQ